MTVDRRGRAPVRIGVAGLGNFGRLHATTIAGLAEAELVALVDPCEANLSAVASERAAASALPTVANWTDLDAALEESDAEAWIVATSTASHVEVTEKLLDAGKTVLLEKPISASLAEAESLGPRVPSDSRNLMLGHIALFNSEFRQLVDEIEERDPIRYIDCVRHRPATTLDGYPGETPFHLTMVHDLVLALVLAGREQPSHLSAQVHRTDSGACDLALAQLQWPSGTVASFTASFLTPTGMASDGFDRLEVFGGDWSARIRANPRPLEVWDSRARWPLALEIRAPQAAPSGMLAEELRCFCRVVRGQQAVPMGATYHDAIQVQGWLDRLENSLIRPAATG